MRDPGVIDALDALERYARAFDEISREQDAHYSARSFVRWCGWSRRHAMPDRRNSHELHRDEAAKGSYWVSGCRGRRLDLLHRHDRSGELHAC